MSEAKPRHPRFHGRTPRDGECAQAGCRAPGEFRAPLAAGGPDGPGAWRWLCLDHVREFNARYNFFTGMSPDEIVEAQRPTAGWASETRAFSGVGAAPRWADFSDPLEAISARFARTLPPERRDSQPLSGDQRRAIKLLGLEIDADRRALRMAYSERVRRFHPDRNGGDRSFEAKLQEVVAAYQLLKASPIFA